MAVPIAGAVVLAVAAAGFTHLGYSFPARSEPLRGTHVELRIQDGVSARELKAIRDGVLLVDRYLNRSLRRGVGHPVEARVARQDRCRRSESGERSLIGQASAGFLCVDTANIEWKVLMSGDRAAVTAVSGHEYVHVWQAELGCLPSGDRRDYRWIVEGMAMHLAWEALVRAGLATEARVRRTIRLEGDFDSNTEPLRTYEHEGGRPPQYALWHLAIRKLAREAAANGAAPRAKPTVALRAFCARIGAGLPWRAAFLRSFGLSVEEFYARFEAARPGS
jgi:hypothetical protein